MSERTDRMIASLTPWEQDDPNVQGVMVAVGEEYDRIEELMLAVRDQAWPHRADDSLGLLEIHERTLNLPVKRQGFTVPQRQNVIKATFGRRKNGRMAAWSGRMDDLVGAGSWTVEKATPGPHQITVLIDAPVSSGLADVYKPLIERFTPAATEVFVDYSSGFFIGESDLGDVEL